MKKTKNILFLMVLLIGIFILSPKVNAIGEPEIQSITIKQGNTTLTKEGEYYIAPGADNLEISYTLINVSAYGMGPYIEVRDDVNSYYPISSGYYHIGFTNTINVSLNAEYKTYYIKMCDDSNCENVYDSFEITVKYTMVTDSQDDLVYYTKIMQGGTEIGFDTIAGVFELNDLQDATFYVKAENLTPDVNYTVFCGANWYDGGYRTREDAMLYTGTELMAGITHTCVMANYHEANGFNFSYRLGNSWSDMRYLPDPEVYPTIPGINIYTDTNIKLFDADLKYTTSEETLTKKNDDYSGQEWHYLVASNMFNANKTMTMYLHTNGFETRDYNVTLSIYKGNTKVYTRNLTVNGNDINAGYNAEYTGFDPGTESGVRYLFRASVDGVTREADVEYIYSDRELTITKITQGDNELSKVNGTYIAESFEQLRIYPQVSNYSSNEDLWIGIDNSSQSYSPKYGVNLWIDSFDEETQEFTLTLYSGSDCEEIVTFTKVKIQLTNYDAAMNSKIYFYDVNQAGTVIPMTGSGTFIINGSQEATAMIKGENLLPDVTYTLQFGDYNSRKEVSASELADGVMVTADPSESSWIYINIDIDDLSLEPQYFDGTTYYAQGDPYGDYNTIYFNFMTSGTYNRGYQANLKYKNYPSVEITELEDYYADAYAISSDYHNSNNPLTYHIQGNGYENVNYNVNVRVLKDGETEIYNHDFTINGNAINSGTDFDITGLTLPFPSDIDELMEGMYGMPIYYFYIKVDYVNSHFMAVYNSVGDSVGVTAEIFFENGKKNLSVFRGFGNSGMYDTNVSAFTKYSKIYINFLGYGFDDDTVYEYYVNYGSYTEEGSVLNYPVNVTSGTITGKLLKEYGVFVELNNNNHYQNPTYRFYVKKGNEILAYTAPVIYTTELATLANVMLNTANRDLYMYTDEYNYIATKNMPIQITVAGLGFDEDKDYDFEYCYTSIYDNGEEGYNYDDYFCDEVSFNGKDLNDGTVTIDFEKDDIAADVAAYTFSVYGEGEGYFGQGYFTVQFVENKDFLPTLGRYVIEDASDIIKNVRKQTTVSEFVSGITVAEGGTLKVFDKTGENEVTGQIGTGMQGRLIDEYNRNFINIGIAVAGDITGDGNISLTDLVKEKKHLLETELLEDVYEAAGDVDNTHGISITDLVSMCKDVTGIEELD